MFPHISVITANEEWIYRLKRPWTSVVSFISLLHCSPGSKLGSCTAQLLLPDSSQSRQKLQCWAAVKYVHSVLSIYLFANLCCRAAIGHMVPPCMISLYHTWQECLDTSLQYLATLSSWFCSFAFLSCYTALPPVLLYLHFLNCWGGTKDHPAYVAHNSVVLLYNKEREHSQPSTLLHIELEWLDSHTKQPQSMCLTGRFFLDAPSCQSFTPENLN